MTRIAIMQPYFIPYTGYFSLIKAVDIFVLYDCVQFPRRGWVHRNQLTNDKGELSWLTLPIQKAPQNIKIKDLVFATEHTFYKKLTAFPSLLKKDLLCSMLADTKGCVVDYIEKWLAFLCQELELPFYPIRSSNLNVPSYLKAQDRILWICKELQASSYLNAVGGIDLYDVTLFKKHNLTLEFLASFKGPKNSLLERIIVEDKKIILKNIEHHSQSRLCFTNYR